MAAIRWPAFLQRLINRRFCRHFRIDEADAELAVDTYPSLQALFTRRLREGVRSVDPDPDAIVSPVDGAVGAFGVARDGRLLQVKGRNYSVEELLGGGGRARAYLGGAYATFYLSPRDYHRIHVPVAGTVCSARYLPGELWPVNPRAVAHIPSLFARNERLVTFLSTSAGEVAVVAVGATIVGGVVVCFDTLTTNVRRGEVVEREYPDGLSLARGAELGRFEFGSTVVVVLPPGAGQFDLGDVGTPVRMGERVGTLERMSAG